MMAGTSGTRTDPAPPPAPASEALRQALRSGCETGLRYRLAVPRESMRGPSGARLGLDAGASLDFHDYREYQPGDDLRHLDWGVYARSDREIVKLFREEVAPKLDIILDGSRSMDLPGTRKAGAALTLAAACAAAAGNAHCEHAVWVAGERVHPLGGSSGFPATWTIPAFEATLPPDGELVRATPRWRRNGIRLFISDLLWPSPPEPVLHRLADHAAALTVVQLLAAEEVQPELHGHNRFVDIETGETLDVFVDEAAHAAYQNALTAHRNAWSLACRRVGATFVTVVAEELTVDGRLAALERVGFLEGA